MNLVELAIVAMIVAAAISSVMGEAWYLWLAIAAPVCMYWVLVHVSGIPPLEDHMLRSRGEAFRVYQKRTRAFFPLPLYNAWFDRARLVVAAVEIVAGFHASSGHEPPRTR